MPTPRQLVAAAVEAMHALNPADREKQDTLAACLEPGLVDAIESMSLNDEYTVAVATYEGAKSKWGVALDVHVDGLGTVGFWYGVPGMDRGTAEAAHGGYDERMAHIEVDEHSLDGIDHRTRALCTDNVVDAIRDLADEELKRVGHLAMVGDSDV